MIEPERPGLVASLRVLCSTAPCRRYALAIAVVAGALVFTIAVRPRPLLIWNVSASAPIGLYAIGGPRGVAPGTMVLARVPPAWRLLAGERRYLPVNVPLVKRVAAASGDRVCAVQGRILVNGRRVAVRRARDGEGRPMPGWQGCVTLRDGALFLLMDDPASFDGRYFGPTGPGDILGRAYLLWRR